MSYELPLPSNKLAGFKINLIKCNQLWRDSEIIRENVFEFIRVRQHKTQRTSIYVWVLDVCECVCVCFGIGLNEETEQKQQQRINKQMETQQASETKK